MGRFKRKTVLLLIESVKFKITGKNEKIWGQRTRKFTVRLLKYVGRKKFVKYRITQLNKKIKWINRRLR